MPPLGQPAYGAVMDSDVATLYASYIHRSLDDLLAVAERVGDERVNTPPFADTNSIASLIVHCCGVYEAWIGFAGLGRPSDRDRDGEFVATADLAELRILVGATKAKVDDDLAAFASGKGQPSEVRVFAPGGFTSDDSLALHVVEELYQHLGHAELTADALLKT